MNRTETAADLLLAQRFLGPSARFLASGATCVAYTDGERVVRLSAPHPGKEVRFAVDAAIRAALGAAGVPTSQSLEAGVLPNGRAYSVDTFVVGDGSEPLPEGWADLGRALGALHRLPHSGFGLLEDRSDALVGQAQTAVDGLRTRLQDAWPFGETALEDHPLIRAAPELASRIARLRDGLESVIHGQTALCHTDLHRGQFRWREGRLSALLDFGDAAIGPPAWDVASLAYFHGWAVAEEVGRAASLSCGRDAALFGLLLSFHRASRAITLSRPARLTEATQFARSCLERLD